MTVHSPLLNSSERRTTRQGAILVPNSRLARGNVLSRGLMSEPRRKVKILKFGALVALKKKILKS